MDEELKEVKERIGKIEKDVLLLTNKSEGIENSNKEMRDLIISTQTSINDLAAVMRESVARVHERVDVLQAEKTKLAGKEEGRAEMRANMFKWLGGIVTMIAIVGYLNNNNADAALVNKEDKMYERTQRPDRQ